MNIKLHTSLVLTTCTVTGFVLGAFLVDRYREVDREMIELGPSSATMRNIELLDESVLEWIAVNDLVLHKDQVYMLDVSARHAQRLRELIAAVAASPLIEDAEAETPALLQLVDSTEAAVFESRVHNGDDREQRLREIAEQARPLAGQLRAAVEELGKSLQLRAEQRRRDLEEQQRYIGVLSWLAAGVFIGFVWLCWLWLAHRIVAPIVSLSEAAGRADDDEREFMLPRTGPAEVRQLTRNLSSFVSRLQEAKASTEEQVRQRTAELVRANQAKGQFLATMSHELRTPLNGIINMNELMLETDLDQEQEIFARTAKSAAESLLALINDILDFSKIEARKLELENVEFDVREFVDSAIEILAGLAETKGLELQAMVAAEVPAVVTGDPTRLRQVLINLLNNALKFTSVGSVSVRVVALAVSDAESVLRFEVADTGIGVPAGRRASLFTAFEQGDSSTTRKYGGTGLGLAICRELVGLMGGAIDVESKEGEGATFWFTARLGRPAGAARRSAASDLSGHRVAVVTRRALLAERLVEQLCFLGVARGSIRVVKEVGDLDADDAGGALLAVVDPYARGEDAAAEVARAQAHPRIDAARVGVLDHWLRHWTAEMGAVPRGVVRVVEPTVLESLRAWLTGVGVEALGELVAVAPKAAASKATAAKGRPAKAPARRSPAPRPAPSPSGAADGAPLGRVRVLVVEDTEVNQRVVRSILERAGYEARIVENGRIAVEVFGREQFDLVLMDCHMPVMDGLEATRRIRALELQRAGDDAVPSHVPIIALTANAQEDFDKECFAAGMDRFMAKPCRRQPLLETIERCLGARRTARAGAAPVPRVLVADDDAINRKVAQSVLGRAGYDVALVENGQQAVDRLREEAFDIVLMDCQMPVLDGIEACRHIRGLEGEGHLANKRIAHVPIVAMTGNVQDADREAALAAGMDGYVTKPFRPRDLVEVVARFTSQVRQG